MEQTLQALAGILLKAIPTVIIVLLLHWYLKAMLFKPLGKVLQQREEATVGARKRAADSLAAAEKKAVEFDQALHDARTELYREQEVQRNRWLEDQAAQVKEARKRANEAIQSASARIEGEAASARSNLVETSAALAEQITQTVLGRGANA